MLYNLYRIDETGRK